MVQFDIVKDDISDVEVMWDVIRKDRDEWILVRSFDTEEEAKEYIASMMTY